MLVSGRIYIFSKHATHHFGWFEAVTISPQCLLERLVVRPKDELLFNAINKLTRVYKLRIYSRSLSQLVISIIYTFSVIKPAASPAKKYYDIIHAKR